jgi:hypothetical protein
MAKCMECNGKKLLKVEIAVCGNLWVPFFINLYLPYGHITILLSPYLSDHALACFFYVGWSLRSRKFITLEPPAPFWNTFHSCVDEKRSFLAVYGFGGLGREEACVILPPKNMSMMRFSLFFWVCVFFLLWYDRKKTLASLIIIR